MKTYLVQRFATGMDIAVDYGDVTPANQNGGLADVFPAWLPIKKRILIPVYGIAACH
jgi:hypothetical protein